MVRTNCSDSTQHPHDHTLSSRHTVMCDLCTPNRIPARRGTMRSCCGERCACPGGGAVIHGALPPRREVSHSKMHRVPFARRRASSSYHCLRPAHVPSHNASSSRCQFNKAFPHSIAKINTKSSKNTQRLFQVSECNCNSFLDLTFEMYSAVGDM